MFTRLLAAVAAGAVAAALWVPVPAVAAGAPPAPKALLVMAFRPGESLRASAVADLQSTVMLLREYGFGVFILDAYTEEGGIAECPHHGFHRHVEDNRYNLLVYYGHGSDQDWALCLPQDGNWARSPDTPQGWDEVRRFGDRRQHWQDEVRLAPNAMVLMRHVCYSNGLEAADMPSGARQLTAGEVLRRVNEYSCTFLQPNTGARSYAALASVGITPSYLENLFRNHEVPIAELTVPDESASHRPGDGYLFLSGGHYYLAGMGYRKSRYPGATNSAAWGQPAWAGDPGLRISDVCGGVPGDRNGDGDNTDLGEPCFPHDSRDAFKAEDASYDFFPFICIANPGAAGTWAEVTFFDEGGECLTIYREVPAESRITVDLNANRHLRNRNLAIKARSVDGVPLLVERPMYFRYNGWMDGGSDAFGCTEPRTEWFFAEGYTSEAHPFREYVCLGNFGEETARGTMTLYGGGGEPVRVDVEVPPGSRQTQYINAYMQGEVSVRVETDRPIAAERSLYFRYRSLEGGFTADGGHTKPGVASTSDYWYFAEGHVSEDFEEWISLVNPGDEETAATVTYYTPGGRHGEREVVLPPRSRRSVFVNDAFASETDVSVEVRAGGPIACERAMYFAYNGAWDDGHVSPGVNAPAARWMFAEGSAFHGIDEYVLLMNPGDRKATVRASYLLGPGEGTRTATYEVGPHSRFTVNVNGELAPLGSPSQVALSLVSDRPVVAERAMYFDMGRGGSGKEPIRGGHVSLGAREAAPEWFFAEAYTGR